MLDETGKTTGYELDDEADGHRGLVVPQLENPKQQHDYGAQNAYQLTLSVGASCTRLVASE